MAKVTLTIEDGDSPGTVNVNLESEPGWPGPASEDQTFTLAQGMGLTFTPAQGMGLFVLQALTEYEKAVPQ